MIILILALVVGAVGTVLYLLLLAGILGLLRRFWGAGPAQLMLTHLALIAGIGAGGYVIASLV